ncbi:MAG: hypothetical protein DME18_02440 [Verrucomicrobia bacterium]|nr:MAG: hypothetical protein DME18_02440 [Verrucomicrobiota bacterium]
MARNRKNQSAAVRFGPALKALLICLLIGGSGVGYVWQQNQLFDLGRQKAECEKRLNTLRAQNGQLARHLAELQSPRSLEARARELNLGLTMAQPTQIVRLTDAPVTPSIKPALTPDPAERQYARRQTFASPAR